MILKGHKNKYAYNSNESNHVKAIRLASKALHDRRSDESGVASLFNEYLDKIDETKKIVPFVGNRFNILYHNAGAVYHHHEHIKKFLSTAINKLQTNYC